MHVYWFSPIRYDYLHQRPQKLANQFLGMGIPVTFVQPTGMRDLSAEPHPIRFLFVSLWYHVLALVFLIVRFVPKKHRATPAQRHFTIVSLPVTIPVNRFNSKMLERLNALLYHVFLRREIASKDSRSGVAIVENPFWGSVIERNEFGRVCYDCLDDVSIYAGRASLARFYAYERMLLEKAEVVVTTAEKLEARLRAITPTPIHRIPNGVDVEWFRTQAAACTIPLDLAQIQRPIVGYVGSVAGWLDYELIADVARAMSDFSFVFVGPAEHEQRVQQLRRSLNIFWLGRKSYDDVPAYIQGFDVCMIPFRRGEIAETTNPVKVFEYFALGKPVVSTSLHELKAFEREGLVYFGDEPAAFAAAVKRACAERDPERQVARIQVAAAHSWKILARSFLKALGEEERTLQ